MSLLSPRRDGAAAGTDSIGGVGGPADFYVVGGTMPRTALSYVERQADHDLYKWLRAGEFCYVLTSRQMGKSSLMVRTASHLRKQAGMAVASIDLTAVGQNLSAEQWYLGMLRRIGRQLDLEDQIDDYWKREQRLGPLQRWLATLGDVILEACPENLVIFVDEIDVVRSLPFQTDEFFAGIRDCYNRRAAEPAFRRLTFCLLGVATPSHLIDDPHLTPFNIGRRVELRDFTPTDARPLTAGLLHPGLTGPTEQASQEILDRILYWTDGHPYLTQRYCQAVAAERTIRSLGDVDRICGEIFLGKGAQEKDDNLLFVRESLMRGTESEAELSSLLRLYASIRAGRRVEDDTTDPLINALRLSGITKVERGALEVRNRIYRRVFNRDWVAGNLPGAELRRHRAAFLTGVRRTLAVSTLVMTLVLFLAWTAILQAKRATQREKEQRRLLFWADLRIADQALHQHNLKLASEMLNNHREDAVAAHSFVWGYLWKQYHGEDLTLRAPGKGRGVVSAAFSPSGRYLALGANDGVVHIRDSQTGVEQRVFTGGFRNISEVAFSPDGKLLAAGGSEKESSKTFIRIWSLRTGRLQRSLSGPSLKGALQFSPDSRYLETDVFTPDAQCWNLKTGSAETPMPAGAISRRRFPRSVPTAIRKQHIALSPNGRYAAISSPKDPIRLVDTATGRDIRRVGENRSKTAFLAFSPDSRLLAGGDDDAAHIWNAQTGQEIKAFRGETGSIHRLAFSPDGKRLVTVSTGGTAKIWRLDGVTPNGPGVPSYSRSVRLKGFQPKRGRTRLTFSSDGNAVSSFFQTEGALTLWDVSTGKRQGSFDFGDKMLIRTAFRPGSHELVVATKDDSLRVFDTQSRTEDRSLEGANAGFYPLAYSPDGSWLATQQREKIVVQNLENPHLSFPLDGHKKKYQVVSGAFSPDGRLLATGSWDATAKIWDVSTRTLLRTLGGHHNEVRAVAFCPDGVTVATASPNGIIKFWDINLGREIITLDTGFDRLAALTFTPDGLELKVAFEDGVIRSWSAASRGDIERWIADSRSGGKKSGVNQAVRAQ